MGGSGEGFGFSVAISGDYAIAGAYHHDNPDGNSGLATFYVAIQGGRLNQTWQFDGLGNPPSPRLRRAGWTATTVNGVTEPVGWACVPTIGGGRSGGQRTRAGCEACGRGGMGWRAR